MPKKEAFLSIFFFRSKILFLAHKQFTALCFPLKTKPYLQKITKNYFVVDSSIGNQGGMQFLKHILENESLYK